MEAVDVERQPRRVSGWTPAKADPLTVAQNDRLASSAQASTTSHCPRSRSSFGYVLGAAMIAALRGSRSPTQPGAVQVDVAARAKHRKLCR